MKYVYRRARVRSPVKVMHLKSIVAGVRFGLFNSFEDDYLLFLCPAGGFFFFFSQQPLVMLKGGKIWHHFNKSSSLRSAQFPSVSFDVCVYFCRCIFNASAGRIICTQVM